MTERSRDPYYDLPRVGREDDLDEPERGEYEQQLADPAGRRVPFVEGPTGASPLASELRGDPESEGDRRGETGAMGGAIAGTAVAGPVGGVVGGVVGATLGAAAERGDKDARDAELEID